MVPDNTWHEYMHNNFDKFFSSLSNDDFISGEKKAIDEGEIDFSEPKKTYESLRKLINQNAIKRLQNRYRAHKHRKAKGIKNLQLKERSLIMLERFKGLVGADTLEEAIDFLLSPDYQEYKHDVEYAKERLSDDHFNDGDTLAESFAKRLKNYDRERLLLIIKQAFNEGWVTAKQTKKRTGSAQEDALSRFDIYNSVHKTIVSRKSE